MKIKPIPTDLWVGQTVTAVHFNPLTPELPSMGSPDLELPDTTLFVTVFYQNFQADILALWE